MLYLKECEKRNIIYRLRVLILQTLNNLFHELMQHFNDIRALIKI